MATAAVASGLGTLPPGTTTGVGALPHRSAGEASRFALAEFDLPAIPSLPRRSPAEGLVAQAVVGIAGVTAGPYGSLAVDVGRVDPEAPVETDVDSEAFRGLRSFLRRAAAVGFVEPVKWQFVGPITLGIALARAGLAEDLAFTVADRAVRAHLVALADAVAEALPRSAQVVVINEPWLAKLTAAGFPLAPDAAIDLLSGAMASVARVATVGVHCCSGVDVASLVASGPDLLSIPTHPTLVGAAGYLGAFLAGDGRIAWGVVPTVGPMFMSVDRPWRSLRALWDELVERGVDADLLRDRSLVTPQCGLGVHTPLVAQKVCHAVRDVGRLIGSWTPWARPRGA